MGHPGLVLGGEGTIDGWVFESENLAAARERLDDFEGTEYSRVEVTVHTEHGPVATWVYALA